MEDTGETESGKSSNWTNSHSKNSEQDTSHGIEPTNPSNSQDNTESNDTERKKCLQN